MSIFSYILVTGLCIWNAVYLTSYGIWTWNKQKKSGAVAIFVLALVSSAGTFIIFLIKR